MVRLTRLPKYSKALLPLLILTTATSCPTLAQLPYYGSNMGGGIGCVVTANKLFSHGNYIRELNADEVQEMAKYRKEMIEFKEKVEQAYANMEAIVRANGTMPPLPNRPMMPAFCASKETTLYILGGCTVQNHKIYIAGKFARELNDHEKQQLDAFAKQMASAASNNYATAMMGMTATTANANATAATSASGEGGQHPPTTTVSPLTEAGRQIALDFCTEF